MDEETELPRILLVDDEPLVLEGLSRQLVWDFEVLTATSGAQGLDRVTNEGPFAVVVSDMRMPQMDGAEFLEQARAMDPSMVRILLTGQSDLQQAIRAVNHGQLFRFLSKPCPPDVLTSTLHAAVHQNRLLTAEKELLEQTLRGAIQTLLDTLALVQPDLFGRARQMERRVGAVLDHMQVEERWHIQLASLLCHVPVITLPPETLHKYLAGRALSDAEKQMVLALPDVGEKLLGNIPRIERVREVLRGREERQSKEKSLGARILQACYDFHLLRTRGVSEQAALETLRRRDGVYDPEVMTALAASSGVSVAPGGMREIHVAELRVGMILAGDVKAKSGMTVVGSGTEITPSLLQRLHNFASGAGLLEPIQVVSPEQPGAVLPQLAIASGA